MKKNSIVIIFLLIFMFMFFCFLNYISKKDNFTEINSYSYNYEYNQIENVGDYYLIKNCIEKFYYNYYLASYEDLNKKCILDLLDNNIIKKYNVNINNILDVLGTVDKENVQIDNIVYTSNENMFFYYVKGILQNYDTYEIKDFACIVILDYSHMSYSIVLEKYIDDFIYEDIVKSINSNDNNKFSLLSISIEKYVNDIFYEIRNNMLYYSQKAYYNLDNRNIFNKFRKFEEYIKSNYNDIYMLTYDNYILEVKENCIVYSCKDKNNKFNIKIIIIGLFKYKYNIEKI